MDKLKTENDHLVQRQAQLHDESLYHEQQYLQIETRLKEIESENQRLKSGRASKPPEEALLGPDPPGPDPLEPDPLSRTLPDRNLNRSF